MRRHRLLAVYIFMVFSIAFAQVTFAKAPKKPLSNDLSKTLGFIMGQRFSLNRIKNEYPLLSLQAQKAELEFKSTFGVAEKNINKSLKDLLKDKYQEYISTLDKELKDRVKSQQINQDIAINFLNEVESRANGEIPSPMLETLLNYQFEARPSDEFTRGFRYIYRTKGHSKSKGIDLQLEYVKSWSKREGNRPNVIQFFSSNNGRGPAYVSIMARDLVEEMQGELSIEEINAIKTLAGSKELALEIFSKSSLREIADGMGTNVRNINEKQMVIDNWPGIMLEFTCDKNQLDLSLTMYNRLYIAIYKNYVIFLSCQIAKLPGETDDALKTKISRFEPLFRLMANSLVIQSQY